MKDLPAPERVGRVLRASTTEFTIGCANVNVAPNFGAFVRVATTPQTWVYGIVYNVLLQDDLFARQIIANESIPPEIQADMVSNRSNPVEAAALAVGYVQGEQSFQYLPPQPPSLFADVYGCTAEEVTRFTEHLDYFRSILAAAKQVPADELLAANIRLVATQRPGDPNAFRIRAGQEAARLLKAEHERLKAILRRI